jgi:hypothetical protein
MVDSFRKRERFFLDSMGYFKNICSQMQRFFFFQSRFDSPPHAAYNQFDPTADRFRPSHGRRIDQANPNDERFPTDI